VTDTLSEAPKRISPVKRRAIWLIPIGLAVAALMIIGLIIFSGGSPGVTDQRQLASVQRVCSEWSGNSATNLGTMGSVCRQWMNTESRASLSTTASPGWCDAMVSQMQQHIGNWGGWMMNGNMMGGDSTG
jgi:hypothetical protein